MKELIQSKAAVFASVNVYGALLSMILNNPLGFIAAVIALLAGIFNLMIQFHQWKREKEGWLYNLLFRWKILSVTVIAAKEMPPKPPETPIVKPPEK